MAENPTRVDAFSDGVFAIAITLLILEIRVPHVDHGLWNGLLALWPSYVAFLLSFVVILIMWVNHRSEEHTSELQSLAYLVCRLLLEKKKQLRSLHRGSPAWGGRPRARARPSTGSRREPSRPGGRQSGATCAPTARSAVAPRGGGRV